MKTLLTLSLCCVLSTAFSQFHPSKSTAKVYSMQSITLPVYKPQYTMAFNTSPQRSSAVLPQSGYTPVINLPMGTPLGSSYYYTGKNGTTLIYTFDEMGNYSGSVITFKEKEKKKKSDKNKFKH